MHKAQFQSLAPYIGSRVTQGVSSEHRRPRSKQAFSPAKCCLFPASLPGKKIKLFVYTHNGIQCNFNKSNLDKTQGYRIKWNKLGKDKYQITSLICESGNNSDQAMTDSWPWITKTEVTKEWGKRMERNEESWSNIKDIGGESWHMLTTYIKTINITTIVNNGLSY